MFLIVMASMGIKKCNDGHDKKPPNKHANHFNHFHFNGLLCNFSGEKLMHDQIDCA